MIYVKIATEERKLEEADQQWITQSIIRHRRAHGTVCVQVRFDLPGITVRLTTHDCPRGPGSPIDHFSRDERRLIEFWRELDLFEDPTFPPGKIIAFLNRATRIIGTLA